MFGSRFRSGRKAPSNTLTRDARARVVDCLRSRTHKCVLCSRPSQSGLSCSRCQYRPVQRSRLCPAAMGEASRRLFVVLCCCLRNSPRDARSPAECSAARSDGHTTVPIAVDSKITSFCALCWGLQEYKRTLYRAEQTDRAEMQVRGEIDQGAYRHLPRSVPRMQRKRIWTPTNKRRIRQQAQSLDRTQFHRSIRNPQHN